MNELNKSLISGAEQYVTNLFSQKIGKEFLFHSFAHTRDVVLHCDLIAGNYELNEADHTALLLAAWFHDTGYSASPDKVHEEESQKIATAYLKDRKVAQEMIDKVNACILATRVPQSPANLIEQIICDADLFHLGTSNFSEKSKLLRQEINKLQEEKISKKAWRNMNIEFLERHRYFTEYARETLEPVKQNHLKRLVEKAGMDDEELHEKAAAEPEIDMAQLEQVSEGSLDRPEAEPPKMKKPKTDRGVVAMFKIMSDSHNNLSQMADSKANIMISVNTIVISIMVSVLLGKLQFYPEFIIPTVILVVVCLLAIVFAILATRPNISGGTFTRDDIQNKQVNLLFFGNFYNMQLPDYDWAMKELMKDKDHLYGTMIKDIYFLGLVLARKYKFLRWSYSVFMYGLICAIVAFVLVFIFSD